MKVILENLSKYFGEVKAVDNLSLKIKDGEFVSFLGPSGCGKTTTLLMIAGIYKPTEGYIYFDDKVVNNTPSKDRNIGMVFQSYALYPHMTVYDNIAFPLKIRKSPKEEMKGRAEKIARLVQIEELLQRKPSQLSGGQQQRVALCRALVREPDVLLLDEPLSNLDARLRITMRMELKRLQKELGITSVFVTHDQMEAMTLADRIAVINQGRLQQFGTPDELYDSPDNIFVAGFIGMPPMNFIIFSLERKGDKSFLKNSDLQIGLPDKISKDLMANLGSPSARYEITLGIRPEDIAINQKSERESIEAEVYVIEPMGRDILTNFRVGKGGTILKVLTPSFIGEPGEKIHLSFNMDKIHLFGAGGRSLMPGSAFSRTSFSVRPESTAPQPGTGHALF